ncbi:MAG: dTMP kinase [Propionibacteriaceae bacterium]|jgi:dTMP kinase|nr:dTMP kinase [Propionibacteriaceae bacterium]
MSGTFIVFEGGDGVGKSTQCRLLVQSLRKLGIDAVQTQQPGGTEFGTRLRNIILDPDTGDISDRAEALVYVADKAQHVEEVILPALQAGAVVISDRYVDSMLAYQGAGRNQDISQLRALAKWATGGLLPELTVVLDLDPRAGLRRIVRQDRLESAGDDFHLRVRQWFLDTAASDPQHYFVVPGCLPINDIAAQVLARVVAVVAS